MSLTVWPICPSAKMDPKRNEVEVHWVGKDMFKIAKQTIENYPEEKQLVLCIGDPKRLFIRTIRAMGK